MVQRGFGAGLRGAGKRKHSEHACGGGRRKRLYVFGAKGVGPALGSGLSGVMRASGIKERLDYKGFADIPWTFKQFLLEDANVSVRMQCESV